MAQEPILLKDFNTNGVSAFPDGNSSNDSPIKGIATEKILFFLAETPGTGEEIFRTTGTEVGTILLKDIKPGASESNIRFLGVIGDKVLFSANDGINGFTLWSSEGTESSTRPVENEDPIELSPFGSLRSLVFKEDLYFRGDRGQGSELYKYDAQTGLITLVREINQEVSNDGSGPFRFAAARDHFYFTADDGINGRELWQSDGTPEGTELVRNISGGDTSTNIIEMKTIENSNTLVFVADDGVNGTELWISVGPGNFTYLVKDITPGEDGSTIELMDLAGELEDLFYFTVLDDRFRQVLWRTNGSEEGTEKVLDPSGNEVQVNRFTSFEGQLYIASDTNLWRTGGVGLTLISNEMNSFGVPDEFAVWNDSLFFVGGNFQDGFKLFKTNGTPEGTVQVTDSTFQSMGSLFATEDHLYFVGRTVAHGTELYVSDGSPAGTFLLFDGIPGPEGSFSRIGGWKFHTLEDQILFPGFSPEFGRELWVSDGTREGTRLLRNINTQTEDGQYPSPPIALGNKTFFTTNQGLWETDGSQEGTRNIYGDTIIYGLNTVGDRMIFSVPLSGSTSETFSSDGTAEGTRFLLEGFSADSISFFPQPGYPIFQGNLYLPGRKEGDVSLLWKTDGTREGTLPVKNINPDGFGFGGFAPGRFLVWEEELFFAATVEGLGSELWKTDGTEEGTVPVADINPFSSSLPLGFTQVGDGFLFLADDGTSGRELWKSDGTTEGTLLVKDIFPGSPNNDGIPDPILKEFKGKLYFNGTDGENGRELWISDGTEEGTRMLKDIAPGPGWGNPRYFAVLDSTLYFASNNQLWTTDGTEEGTMPAVDVRVRSEMMLAGSDLFFLGVDPENGFELWRTDGTEEGTFLVKDIFPQGSSIPELQGYINEVLYFTAMDPEKGRELFALSPVRIQTRLMANQEDICGVADSIIFAAQVENAGDNPIFSWYVNGQFIPGVTGPELVTVGLKDGSQVSYRVLASDKSVWRLEQIVSSDTLDVGLSALDPQIQLSDNQLTASPAASYRWFLDGILLPDTTQVITPTEIGDYQVEITNLAGCSARSKAVNVSTVTNIIDPRLARDIRLFPNPANDQVFIQSNLNEEVDLSIYSANGKLMYQGRLNAMQTGFTLPISHFADGLYLIRMSSSQGWYHRKVIKQ